MKVCPKCKSKDITETIYGLISESGMKDLEKELENGKVRLGGCCIDENSKQFWCNNCTFEWGRP
jgi:hypothetical protein